MKAMILLILSSLTLVAACEPISSSKVPTATVVGEFVATVDPFDADDNGSTD